MAVIFGVSIIKSDAIWFSIVIGLFCLLSLAMGAGFLTIFIRKFNIGNLVIGQDFIEIPGRWRDRVRIRFDEIEGISEFDTYDNVIEIESRQGVYLIEGQWMAKKDFYEVRTKLQEYLQKESTSPQ